MNKLFISLIAFLAIIATSCSKDDEPQTPVNAISLNMMIGDDNTTIGGSDVHINSSLNFATSYCDIADLGKRGGFNMNPNLQQIANEMAVTPGNFYQITSTRDMGTVAGVRALAQKAAYYNMLVDSWIYDKDKNIVGAKISYVECHPNIKELPEWDSEVPVTWQNDNYYYKATCTFPKGCIIDPNVNAYYSNGYSDLTDELKFDINENRITVSFQTYSSNHLPYVEILVRYDYTYTRVSLDFSE